MHTSALAARVALLVFSFAAPRLFAACAVTLSAGSPSNGRINVTASASGNCGGSLVEIYLDDNRVAFKNCRGPEVFSSSCTLNTTLSTICLKSGHHTLTAGGECGRSGVDQQGQPNCTNEAGSAASGFSVNTTPTVSLSVSDPDATGQSNVSISYGFPNTDGWPHRRVQFVTDGERSREETFDTESGVWQFPISLTCLKGTHTYQAVAFACGGISPTTYPGDPSFITASNIETKMVSSKPTVGVTWSDPDEDGNGEAIVNYSFPNTVAFPQRRVRLARNGERVYENTFDPQSGSFTVPMSFTCAPAGNYEITATAFACGGIGPTTYPSDPDFIDHQSTTVSVDHKPNVSVAVDVSVSPVIATVSYAFPKTNSSTQRLVQLLWVKTGQLIAEKRPETVSGTWQVECPDVSSAPMRRCCSRAPSPATTRQRTTPRRWSFRNARPPAVRASSVSQPASPDRSE